MGLSLARQAEEPKLKVNNAEIAVRFLCKEQRILSLELASASHSGIIGRPDHQKGFLLFLHYKFTERQGHPMRQGDHGLDSHKGIKLLEYGAKVDERV